MNKVLVLPFLVMKTDNGTVLIKIKVSHRCNTYLIFLGLIIAISFTLRIKEKLINCCHLLISGFIFIQGSIRSSARA